MDTLAEEFLMADWAMFGAIQGRNKSHDSAQNFSLGS